MARTTTVTDALPYVAQPSSLNFDMGRDIDWANTGDETTIPASTVMVLIAASGKMCPRTSRPATETAYGLLLASADKNDKSGLPGHGLIIGGVIFANLTTDFAETDWATQVTELGTNFQWLTYGDDRIV